jgi:hypothetical protein
MCLTVEESVMAFVVMIVVSIMLILRNQSYDRIFGIFFIAVAVIQLIEAFYHGQLLTAQVAGSMIFLTLLFQLDLLALLCCIYYPSSTTKTWLVIVMIVTAIAVISNLDSVFSVIHGKHLIWQSAEGNILGSFKIFYLLGLFVPFIILLHAVKKRSYKLWLVLAALILSFLVVWYAYPQIYFTSMWCYSAIGVIFVAWLAGAFNQC